MMHTRIIRLQTRKGEGEGLTLDKVGGVVLNPTTGDIGFGDMLPRITLITMPYV